MAAIPVILIVTEVVLIVKLLRPIIGNMNAIRLGDVKQITFNDEAWVDNVEIYDRSSLNDKNYKQLICRNGTAGCEFDLKQVTCYNEGVVQGKIKWRCSAPKVITFPYRFGETEVWCGTELLGRHNDPSIYSTNCGLIYTVEYIGTPFIHGAVAGLMMGYGIFKLYKKYSVSTAPVSQVKVAQPQAIVFNEDPFNAWVWGTSSSSSQRKRGPHSIGATTETTPTPAQEEGGLGDMVPPAGKASKLVFEEEEDDGDGAFQSCGLSSRTSSGGTVTVTRFQLAAVHGRAQEGGRFGDGVPPTPWKANKVVIDEDDGAFQRSGSTFMMLSSRTSSGTSVTSSPPSSQGQQQPQPS